MPKYQYNKIRTLPKGGILVFPDSVKDLNGFLTDWTKDSFGGTINVLLPESKVHDLHYASTTLMWIGILQK